MIPILECVKLGRLHNPKSENHLIIRKRMVTQESNIRNGRAKHKSKLLVNIEGCKVSRKNNEMIVQ